MSTDKYEWVVGERPPELEAHSAAKHEVLGSYVGRYLEVLTSNPRLDTLSLTLVDGFAGGGQYVFQGKPAFGSPMILLQEVACAQAHLTEARRKPFRLNAEFVFVERSASSKAFLEHTIRATEYGPLLDKSAHLLGGQFEQELPGIIQRIRSRNRAQRSIFFLDQYGYNQVSLETIRTILTSLENPEIIVTFNVDSLIAYLNEDDDFLKGVKPVELDQSIVKQMLAIKDQSEGRWLIQNMLFRHLRDKTGAPFYTCFFIKSPASHRSYWLIHISKHPKARDEMALRHWAMSNHFVHHGRAGLKMLGFDPEQNIQQIPLGFFFDDDAETRSKNALMNELPPLIFDGSAGGHTPPSLGTLFTSVCNDTPATMKQISDVLVDLRNEREIEIVTKDGRSKPRAGKVQWTDVILPARQRSLLSTVWPATRA
jgi:three-Cys-motif partner protein